MQIAREEPFGSLQKEADIFCLKFTLKVSFCNESIWDIFCNFQTMCMIADISEKCMKISWKILIGRSSIMCLKIHWNVLLIKIRKPKPPPNYEGKQDESITHAKIQSGWKMAWLLQSWEEVEPSEQLSWRKPSGTHGNFNLNCCTFSLEIACEIFLSVADDTTRLRNHCHHGPRAAEFSTLQA